MTNAMIVWVRINQTMYWKINHIKHNLVFHLKNKQQWSPYSHVFVTKANLGLLPGSCKPIYCHWVLVKRSAVFIAGCQERSADTPRFQKAQSPQWLSEKGF